MSGCPAGSAACRMSSAFRVVVERLVVLAEVDEAVTDGVQARGDVRMFGW
ncbi:MAG: hypothetical protein U1E83_05650 [Methylotetracoccus sp.]